MIHLVGSSFLLFIFTLPVQSGAAINLAQNAPTAVGRSTAGPTVGASANSPIQSLESIIEDYDYNPLGKRDPFRPYRVSGKKGRSVIGPVTPLQQFDLDQLKIVGIIWDVPKPKAMLVDPTGKGHVVVNNDRIGRNNGYVAAIREGEIVIVEAFENQGRISYTTRVMKIPKGTKQ